jgi:hypothetical protein
MVVMLVMVVVVGVVAQRQLEPGLSEMSSYTKLCRLVVPNPYKRRAQLHPSVSERPLSLDHGGLINGRP